MKQELSIVYGLDELPMVTEQIKKLLNMYSFFTFTGSLGAGKTTLVRSVLRSCGVQGVIASPTFTYVNVYENEQGDTFYHFDLYRIDSLRTFMDMGFDEYLNTPNSWVFIEWPEVILPLLSKGVCHCFIEYHQGGDKRLLTVSSGSVE